MCNATLENSTLHQNLEKSGTDDTIFTFSLGFGILLVIIIFGILGSAFLCLSLEKDSGNLWPVESSTQTETNQQGIYNEDSKDTEDTVAEIVCA